MPGFRSPLFVLGIGTACCNVGKGRSPLPFIIGYVPSVEPEPSIEVISTGGTGTSDYTKVDWSMWDLKLPQGNLDRYKILRQADQEMFEILEILTLSGNI